jgi:hypothetical protein
VKNELEISGHMNTMLMLDAAKYGDLELAEQYGLKMKQTECRVEHLFGPGFCIREMHIPAGTFVIGHAHRQPLANMLVQGTLVVQSEGRWSHMTAPLFFVGVPGRKSAIALTDSIWQNILVTDETDPSVIEELFVEKSPHWLAKQEQLK